MLGFSKSLYRKELASYFNSPLGYVFLVIFLFGMGYLTFEPGRGSFFLVRETSLTAFFRFVPWMFLFLIPAVSMKLWADERKSGTIELLFTMPLSTKEAVLAKFLASLSFVAIALMCTFPMVLTVIYLGTPDFGPIITGYLGSLLLAGVLLAIGGFYSALTKNQVISFILTVVTGFMLLMAGSPPVLSFLESLTSGYVVAVFESLSLLRQFEQLERGTIGLSNVWFFAVMIGFWLYGTIALLSGNKAD